MVETLSMSCMQQQPYFSSPLTTVSPACKGVVNLHHHLHPSENSHQHHQHHHHQHNNAMKSLTPEHDPQLGDLGDLGATFYSENMVDYDSNRMFHRNQTSITDISYDSAQCYSNGTDCTNVSAVNKTLMVVNNAPLEIFEGKLPSTWNRNQLLLWISRVCEENKLDYQKLRCGLDNLTGDMLDHMGKSEFITRFHNDGAIVYDAFQRLRSEMNYNMENSSTNYQYNTTLDQSTYWDAYEIPNHNNNNNNFLHMSNNIHHFNSMNQATSNNHQFGSQYMLPSPNAQTMVLDHDNQVKLEMDSEGESNHSYTNLYPQDNIIIPSVVDTTKLQRRKPGRPPIKDKKSKNGGQRNSRLWEFIRDLLLDSKTCPSLLKWENVDEGIFRFVQSDKVARLWGERKCNPRMTYEKLSRAMRYYYKSQVFQPVIGRRLVYKFGPNATGWRPSPALYS